MHRRVAVEAEQRRSVRGRRRAGPAPLDLFGEELAHTGPVGNQPVLAELASVHREQAPPGIHVAKAQAARLAGAQPQPVAQGEDPPVGLASCLDPWGVGQGGGRGQQPAGLGGVEDEGEPVRAAPARPCLQRRGRQQLLGHGPVEEDPHGAQEVVEAARTTAGPGGQEVLQQAGVQLAETAYAAQPGEGPQQGELPPFAVVLAPDGPTMGEEGVDRRVDGVVDGHPSTSSPSPSATCRKVSTATLP